MRCAAAIIVGLGGCGFHSDAASPEVDAPPGTEPDAAVDAGPLVCPTTAAWISITGLSSKYMIESGSAEISQWWRANLRCNAAGAGIHLVVFDSNQEAVYLSAKLQPNKIYYTGMLQPNGPILAADGWTQITGRNAISWWGNGEPNDDGVLGNTVDTGVAQFAVIDMASFLRDADGHLSRDYVCECDGRAVDTTIQIPPQ